jgi:hypothetical protein
LDAWVFKEWIGFPDTGFKTVSKDLGQVFNRKRKKLTDIGFLVFQDNWIKTYWTTVRFFRIWMD